MKKLVEGSGQVNKLVAESQISDIEKLFTQISDYKSVPELVRLKEEFSKLKEEITVGDWGRIGVLAGLLWYKLDMIVSNLSTAVNSLRNIERNTSKIK